MMKPHLLKEVRNTAGDPVVTFQPEVLNVPDVDPKHYEIVRDALDEVAYGSRDILNAMDEAGINPENIGSKTGTGEVAGKGDVAWYVCYYPVKKPKYVVATCIEEGGAGARAAGPTGIRVMGAIIAAADGNLTDIGTVAASNGKSVEYNAGSGGRTD